MTNVLKNSGMRNWKHGHYFTDKEGRVGTVEYPDGWDFHNVPKESDPNKKAESLHRDNGFVISAAYRAWEAGYVQKGVQLKANQRYLAKARFKPDVNFPVGQQERTDAVLWQFRMTTSTGDMIEQGWQMTPKGQYKQQEEMLWVFDSAAANAIDYAFIAYSPYAGNDCDLWVYELTLEEVAPDYGGASAPVLGKTAAETISDAPAAPKMPSAETASSASTEPAAHITTATGPNGKSLGEVLSPEDIDQIAAGLRALASANNDTIAKGLNKLADGLERLK